jgi:hypothetical protein
MVRLTPRFSPEASLLFGHLKDPKVPRRSPWPRRKEEQAPLPPAGELPGVAVYGGFLRGPQDLSTERSTAGISPIFPSAPCPCSGPLALEAGLACPATPQIFPRGRPGGQAHGPSQFSSPPADTRQPQRGVYVAEGQLLRGGICPRPPKWVHGQFLHIFTRRMARIGPAHPSISPPCSAQGARQNP